MKAISSTFLNSTFPLDKDRYSVNLRHAVKMADKKKVVKSRCSDILSCKEKCHYFSRDLMLIPFQRRGGGEKGGGFGMLNGRGCGV